MRKEREIRGMYLRCYKRMTKALMTIASLVLWTATSAQTGGVTKEYRHGEDAPIDSSYFSRFGLVDSSARYLEHAVIAKVYAYPHLSPGDTRPLKTNWPIRCDRRLALASDFTVEHCSMDTVDRVELNSEQVNGLLEVMNDSTAFELYGGTCWSPRHSFLFYDAQDLIIGWVMLCFECHEISYAPTYGVSMARTALKPDALKKLERLSEDAGLFTSGISIASFRQPSK